MLILQWYAQLVETAAMDLIMYGESVCKIGFNFFYT